jgi:geranyl-CoA carboxylase beta subunit
MIQLLIKQKVDFNAVDDSGINAGASTSKSVEKALGCLNISLKQKLPFIHLVESAGET